MNDPLTWEGQGAPVRGFERLTPSEATRSLDAAMIKKVAEWSERIPVADRSVPHRNGLSSKLLSLLISDLEKMIKRKDDPKVWEDLKYLIGLLKIAEEHS